MTAALHAVPEPWPAMLLTRVSKIYGSGELAVKALDEVDFRVEPGEYVAIMGSSGSGKSTLMNIVGCLDVPTTGRYLLEGIDVGGLDDFQLAFIRNRRIGFVFQSFNLIPRTSALRNVELPLIYAQVPKAERRRRAAEALAAVGLGDWLDRGPSELSGGMQQRVAIARAIASRPAIVLADEPTGNLDTASSREIMQIFSRLNVDGRTIVMITHEADVAEHAKRVVHLVDGKVDSDRRSAPIGALPPRLEQKKAEMVTA